MYFFKHLIVLQEILNCNDIHIFGKPSTIRCTVLGARPCAESLCTYGRQMFKKVILRLFECHSVAQMPRLTNKGVANWQAADRSSFRENQQMCA